MEYSENFEKVKYYYEHKMWNEQRVHAAIGKWITAEEYTEITAQNY